MYSIIQVHAFIKCCYVIAKLLGALLLLLKNFNKAKSRRQHEVVHTKPITNNNGFVDTAVEGEEGKESGGSGFRVKVAHEELTPGPVAVHDALDSLDDVDGTERSCIEDAEELVVGEVLHDQACVLRREPVSRRRWLGGGWQPWNDGA